MSALVFDADQRQPVSPNAPERLGQRGNAHDAEGFHRRQVEQVQFGQHRGQHASSGVSAGQVNVRPAIAHRHRRTHGWFVVDEVSRVEYPAERTHMPHDLLCQVALVQHARPIVSDTTE